MVNLNPVSKSYLYIHLAVFLWGFTAILGRLITLEEFPLVWWRMLIVSIGLFTLPVVRNNLKKLTKKATLQLSFIGILVAIHWVCFYGAIKYGNVSIALSTLATTAFLTSIIEPLIFRTKVKIEQVLLGIIVIPAIYIMFFTTDLAYAKGITFGMISALFAALFTILNKKVVDNHNAFIITFTELTGGFLFLCIVLPFYHYFNPGAFHIPSANDFYLLVFLALACTILPYILYLYSLKELSAFAINLINNLEPVYGIILAIILFAENKELTTNFYIGTSLVLLSVFVQPLFRKMRLSKR